MVVKTKHDYALRQFAKSGKSRCKKCKESLAKGEIRIGVSQIVLPVLFTPEYGGPHLADALDSPLYLLHIFLSVAYGG